MPRTKKQGKSTWAERRQSLYAKRQRRRAESIILATGVYDADFRRSVQDALKQDKKGHPSALPRLIKEADEIHRQHMEFSKELHARMNADLQERQAIRAKANKVEALVSGPRVTSAQIRRTRSAFLKYAVQSLLFELSTESSIGVDGPGIAGIFYTLAASKLKDSASETEQRYLRHLDVLLNDPDHKSVKAIMGYWDEGKMNAVDPFPAEAGKEEGGKTDTDDEQETDPTLVTLREKLTKLERLPENEEIRFQLESEIYRLEHQVSDEWPEVIGMEGGAR